MFRGNFRAKVDGKGRVAVPVRYRELLKEFGSDELCLTNNTEDGYKWIDVFPQAKWLELENELRDRRERSEAAIHFFQTYYLPGVQECQLDSQGRILLSSRLREYAGLGKEVVFAGVLDKLRIYNTENWEAMFNRGESARPDSAEISAVLGI